MIKVVLKDGEQYTISKEQVEYWEMLYPGMDVRSELGYLKEMWTKNAIPRKTSNNIIKFISRWLFEQYKEEL